MYLNTYDIVFLAVTASGLIALGIYDYTKARSKNFVNTFQKHYQNKISGYQEEERFFSPKTSTPGKRQGLSIILTYFLIFCIGAIPFWVSLEAIPREDFRFGGSYPFTDHLIPYVLSWVFITIGAKSYTIFCGTPSFEPITNPARIANIGYFERTPWHRTNTFFDDNASISVHSCNDDATRLLNDLHEPGDYRLHTANGDMYAVNRIQTSGFSESQFTNP